MLLAAIVKTVFIIAVAVGAFAPVITWADARRLPSSDQLLLLAQPAITPP